MFALGRSPLGSVVPFQGPQPEFVNAKGAPVSLAFHPGVKRWLWMCAMCKSNLPPANLLTSSKAEEGAVCSDCTQLKPTHSQQAFWEQQRELIAPPEGPENHARLFGAPLDTVSEVFMSKGGDGDVLTAGSWDKSVRVWAIQTQQTRYESEAIKHKPIVRHFHRAPVLGVTAAVEDGITKRCFFASAAKVACELNLERNEESVIGHHLAPVKDIKSLFHLGNIVATSSWDGTAKCWDLRMSNTVPAHSIDFAERIWAMDVTPAQHPNPLIALVGPREEVMIYDLRAGRAMLKTTPLKLQKRCVRFFHDSRGVLVGSAEGRCSVVHISEADAKLDFSYKCHRTGHSVYAINALAMNPLGTYCTVGSDGSFHTWDKDNRVRLKHFSPFPNQSITSAAFNPAGSVLAYSTGYDWHEGIHGFKNEPVNIYVGVMKDSEIQPKQAGRR